MKSPYVANLELNQPATVVLLVTAKDIREKKSGDPYLSLRLSDRTGELDAKMWDNVGEIMDTFERNDYVRVKGLLQLHQNRPQLTVHKLARVDEREVDPADFFPASQRDPDEMFAELQTTIAGLTDPHLKTLLQAIFADEEVARLFRIAPAAKQIHHAWRGGLLEHVLSLCKLARFVASHYPGVDLDLLLTGVLLHDIGKIHELTYDRSFGYGDEGQLLGHILLGLRLVDEKARRIDGFPPRLKVLVEHMIASHHGELEYGSPKVPLFPEALLLHHLDNLDSKFECMRAAVARDQLVEGNWTGYVAALDRPVLRKDLYLNERPVASPPQPEPAAASPANPPVPRDQSRNPVKPREERQPRVNNTQLREQLMRAGLLRKD